jgi:hypothetical protein
MLLARFPSCSPHLVQTTVERLLCGKQCEGSDDWFWQMFLVRADTIHIKILIDVVSCSL